MNDDDAADLLPMPQILATERLILRQFRRDDAPDVNSFADDPDYRRYLGEDHPSAADFLANNVDGDWGRAPSWAIELDGRVVGGVFLGIDAANRRAELACLVAPLHWRQGLALEACRAHRGSHVRDRARSGLGARRRREPRVDRGDGTSRHAPRQHSGGGRRRRSERKKRSALRARPRRIVAGMSFASRWVVFREFAVGPDDFDSDGVVRAAAVERWMDETRAAYLERCVVFASCRSDRASSCAPASIRRRLPSGSDSRPR